MASYIAEILTIEKVQMIKTLVTFLLFSLPYEQKFKEVYSISIKNQRSIFFKKKVWTFREVQEDS